MKADLQEALQQLALNDAEIIPYYRLTTILIVLSLLLHLAFDTWYVVSFSNVASSGVYLFVIFNVAALVVELYLTRIAFMLGSRAGQLRDLQYALRIAGADFDASCFEMACRAIMATRRDTSGLKVFDLEAVIKELSNRKGGGKDAS